MRFQALMPDVLHWLGIKKIDNMISMVRPSVRVELGGREIWKTDPSPLFAFRRAT